MKSETLQKEIRWLLEEKYAGERGAAAEKDIKKLEKGEHVDYVIGWVDFLGCKIDLSRRPLIPRPETEYWVEKIIRETVASRTTKFSSRFTPHFADGLNVGTHASQKISSFSRLKILDIFAGSGCIGTAILKHTTAVVDFAEKEERFCEQIEINTKLNEIDQERYKIVQSDLFSNVKGKYDFIFANPPYVAEDRKESVQQSVLANEPYDAVFGGKDGLWYIKKFLKQAKNHLMPRGIIYLEFDSIQKQGVAQIAREFGYKESKFFKDQYKKWRYARVA